MPKEKSFIVEYRYTQTDQPWFDLFGKGKWQKWKAYKTFNAAENAIIALRKNKPLPWDDKNNPKFKYRHAPNKACSGQEPAGASESQKG